MNYDPIETCPYDPVHRILKSRMQFHLSKCAKNWPCTKKKQCPYDARHIINEIEYNYHLSVCQQRESVLHYKIVEDQAIASKLLPIDLTPAAASVEENWEEDAKVQSYDPMKHTENRPVTRILIGASKSERKKHQKQERLRISRLEEITKMEKKLQAQSHNNQYTLSSTQSSVPQASAETEEEYKPLRRPKKLPLDTSKMSDFSSVNNSAAVNQTQNPVNQNKSLQPKVQEKSNSKENVVLKEVYSYAAALKHQQNNSVDSNCSIDVVVESIIFDDDKKNHSSILNNTLDENLIKVSKTVEELAIGDKGHKVQSESLNRTLESLKRTEKNKSVNSNAINNSNNNNTSTAKKLLRCAAKFTNSQMK